jgi:outer membrane protein assembly factor BamB
MNIASEFRSPELTWGHSGTPVIVDNRLILQPGGKDASIVAFHVETGDLIWKTPGNAPAYSSLLLKTVGQSQQVIGYDAKSLGGWDVETGRRLWTVVPPEEGDFNVPTAVSLGDRLLVSSENNGTRVYHFNADGILHSEPDMINEDLTPDSHTPIVSNGRVYGIWSELYGLDPELNLKTVSTLSDEAFVNYGCLMATDSRLLALTDEGELLLMATNRALPEILARLKLSQERTQTLSHPALAGDSLYVRIGRTLAALKLGE